MQKPNLVNDKYTALLRSGLYVPPPVYRRMQELTKNGWTFWAVDQSRGRCYYGPKLITIPVWVFQMTSTKLIWYICHEMSHAFVGYHVAAHGKEFMQMLISICPVNCIVHEAGYKPQNLIRAGAKLSAEHCGF